MGFNDHPYKSILLDNKEYSKITVDGKTVWRKPLSYEINDLILDKTKTQVVSEQGILDGGFNYIRITRYINEMSQSVPSPEENDNLYNPDILKYDDEIKYNYSISEGYELVEDNSSMYKTTVQNDRTTALTKSMPSGTINLNVNEVDGASEVSENLIVLSDVAETTTDGITYKVENGVLNVKGTATSGGVIYIFNNRAITTGTSYVVKMFVSGSVSTSGVYRVQLKNTVDDSYLNALNTTVELARTNGQNGTWYFALLYSEGDVFTNYTIKPMLVVGSTAPSEFKVGYTGIHNFEWTGVKVEGFNVWDEVWEVGSINWGTGGNSTNNNAIRSKNYIPVYPNTTYYLKCPNETNVFYYDENKIWISSKYAPSNSTFTTPYNCKYIRFTPYVSYGSTYNYDICINISGSANGTYVPYITPTTISVDLTSIEDSGGNKLFADGKLMGNANVKDKITPTYQESAWLEYTFSNDSVIEKVSNSLAPNGFYFLVSGVSGSGTKGSTQPGIPNLIMASFTPVTNNIGLFDDMTISKSGQSDKTIVSINANVNTVELAKAYLNGMKLQYERETYLTSNTNLSQLKDITGYSNGSITFVNTHNMDVPSDVDFYIRDSIPLTEDTEFTLLNDVTLEVSVAPIVCDVEITQYTQDKLTAINLYRTLGRIGTIQGESSGSTSVGQEVYYGDIISVTNVTLNPPYDIEGSLPSFEVTDLVNKKVVIDLDQYIKLKTYNLTVTKSTGVSSVVVKRVYRRYPVTSSVEQVVTPGSDVINYGDDLEVTAYAEDHYVLESYTSSYENITSNVEVSVSARLVHGKFSIVKDQGVILNSVYIDGVDHTSDYDSIFISYGSIIVVNASPELGYYVSDQFRPYTFQFLPTSDSYTATLTINSHVRYGVLNITTDSGVDTYTATRISSPIGGGSTGTISNGDTVYHSDVIRITYNSVSGYVVGDGYDTSITVLRICNPNSAGVIGNISLTSTALSTCILEQYYSNSGVLLTNGDIQNLKLRYPDNPTTAVSYDASKQIRVDHKVILDPADQTLSHFDHFSVNLYNSSTSTETYLSTNTDGQFELFVGSQYTNKVLLYPEYFTVKIRLKVNECYYIQPYTGRVEVKFYGYNSSVIYARSSKYLLDYDYNSSYTGYDIEMEESVPYKGTIKIDYSSDDTITSKGWSFNNIVTDPEGSPHTYGMNDSITITENTLIHINRNIINYNVTVSSKYASYEFVKINNVTKVSNWDSPSGLSERSFSGIPYGSKMTKYSGVIDVNGPMVSELSTHDNNHDYYLTGDTIIKTYYYQRLVDCTINRATVTLYKAGTNRRFIKTSIDISNPNHNEYEDGSGWMYFYDYEISVYGVDSGNYEWFRKTYTRQTNEPDWEFNYQEVTSDYLPNITINDSTFKIYVEVVVKGRTLGSVQRTDSNAVKSLATKVISD